jgi:hypothetical protein
MPSVASLIDTHPDYIGCEYEAYMYLNMHITHLDAL